MSRNTQQSDADSPAITNGDATIGDLCRHVKLLCLEEYDALPDAAEIRDGVLDVRPIADWITTMGRRPDESVVDDANVPIDVDVSTTGFECL